MKTMLQEPNPAPATRPEELFETLRPKLRLTLAQVRIPPQDAEDLVQQAFVALLIHWDEVRDPHAWLLGALRNGCRLYWRERRRRVYEAVDVASLEWLAPPEPPYQLHREFSSDLCSALSQLPKRCRAILQLRFLYGLNVSEVAAVLGYRPTSIGKLTIRCLAQAQKALPRGSEERDQVRTPRKR